VDVNNTGDAILVVIAKVLPEHIADYS